MDNDYVIFVPVESKSERTYYYMAAYDFKDDTINFFFSSKGGASNDTLLITLRREEKPTLFYSYMPKGYKFELYGVFPDVSTPYEIYKNEIPEQLFPSTEKVISTTLALMDFYTKEKIGVSFEELGIFYFND